MEEKKPSKAQLENRIKNALVFVGRDKDYQGIYFSDKGLRLEVTQDYAVISTGFHRHVFSAYTAQGYSRPYLYTKRFVEIAFAHDCLVKDAGGDVSYSYAKLFKILEAEEDKTEYNIAWFYDKWMFIIFNNLYSISEDAASTWIVYFKYMSAIAMNSIILDEHSDGLTNKQFAKRFLETIDDFTKNMEENVIFQAISDEERMKQEIEAIQASELDESLAK